MKCPKCGKELKKDQLYCEYCGAEIRFVPDYDPEIDTTINESMSEVAESVDSDGKAGSSFFDNFKKWLMSDKKNHLRLTVSFCILLVLIIILIISLVWNHQFNMEGQLQKAAALSEQENYEDAIEIYESVLKRKDSPDIIVSYAECLYDAGYYDKALNYLYTVIEENPDDEVAYAVIISMFDEQRQYDELNRLLLNCSNLSITEKYKNYMADTPNFSAPAGKYDKVIPLVLTSEGKGKIFYSLDGSSPEKDGEEYSSPIYLKNGLYHVKAVFMNDFGIVSETVSADYEINTKQPDAPVVQPDSGEYHSPMMIDIIKRPGVTVYYTTDNTVPSDRSLLYSEPIPMKEGTSNYHFIAIDESGVSSEITSRSYQLTIEAALTAGDSIYRLRHRLIEQDRILDMEGHIPDRKGNYIYVYDSLRVIKGKNMYTIFEYYTEDGKQRNKTGKIYAIDVSNGYVYRVIDDDPDNPELEPI